MLHRLIDCSEVNKTRFEDVYGGNIEILHSSEILILLLDEKGNYLDPSLDKIESFDRKNEKKSLSIQLRHRVRADSNCFVGRRR